MAIGSDLASANVNRSYSLAATTIAIFTFTLSVLYPRFKAGELDPLLFQATLIVMGVATCSYLVASFLYYGASLGEEIEDARRAVDSRRADRLWLLGTLLLFLAPSLILLTLALHLVAAVWFALWLVYLGVAVRQTPLVIGRRGR